MIPPCIMHTAHPEHVIRSPGIMHAVHTPPIRYAVHCMLLEPGPDLCAGAGFAVT